MEFLISTSENEETQVKNLWKYCFDDTDEYMDYYFTKRYEFENNYIIKDDDEVISSLMTNKYSLKINDEIKNVSYIVGVSSSAVHRGGGYASILIKRTLTELYEKGEDITMLMPIDSYIYTRYGFANIYNMLELDIPIDRIKINKTNLKAVYYEDDIMEHPIEIYNKSMSSIGSYFARDDSYFQNLIDEVKLEGGNIIICYEDDSPIAYMIFYPKYEGGETGFVREIFSLKKSGYDKLMEIVKSHYTQIKNVIVHSYEKSNVFYYFNADNKITYKIKPFMMSRVLNAKKIFQEQINANLRYVAFEGGNLKIKLIDEIIQENNKVFEIRSNKDNGFILDISDSTEDFEMSIYDFSRLVFGYINWEILLFEKNIELSDAKKFLLNLLFQKKNSYFNDYV
ncbi:hypothetical protein HMPREF0379_0802 [[Eubacterium] yurii subsp. margaretiae ATCC 43715]|nr:hypothetical protein HMPREF0379_0802 [[Eubacterium] yurii subsp. margaretiae ATCC 43715]